MVLNISPNTSLSKVATCKVYQCKLLVFVREVCRLLASELPSFRQKCHNAFLIVVEVGLFLVNRL